MTDENPDDQTSEGTEVEPTGDARGRILPPGWNAIDGALATVYQRPADAHFGTRVSWRDGGPDPLDGIGAWRVESGDGEKRTVHWHLVTYGFTELFEKETKNEEVSGFGHELTMRVAPEAANEGTGGDADANDEDPSQPPMWAMSFLQNLARYVFKSGYPLGLHDYMDLHGPICGEGDTPIRAICLVPDNDLRESVDGPFGRFGFLQIIGLTLDELDAVQDWSTEGVMALARERDANLVVSIQRESWLSEPAFLEAAAEGAKRDGSSQGALMADFLGVEPGEEDGQVTIRVSELVAAQIARLMHRRLSYGRDFIVIGRGTAVSIASVKTSEESEDVPTGFRTADDGLPELHLSPDAATAISESLVGGPGMYSWDALPGVTFVVEVPPEEPDEPDEEEAATEDEAAEPGDGN